MLGQYLPIVALLTLAVIFAALSFVASRLLAPRRPHDRKAAPYECGIIPGRETPERFPVRFYLGIASKHLGVHEAWSEAYIRKKVCWNFYQ